MTVEEHTSAVLILVLMEDALRVPTRHGVRIVAVVS